MSRAYKTRAGVEQYMPSLAELQEMDANQEGWCLACGETQAGCEPDARRYKCEACGAHKVYGVGELALMGLVDTGD